MIEVELNSFFKNLNLHKNQIISQEEGITNNLSLFSSSSSPPQAVLTCTTCTHYIGSPLADKVGPAFLPYAGEILKIIIKNVYDGSVHRKIKLACITTLGEVALSPLKNEVLPVLTTEILQVGGIFWRDWCLIERRSSNYW